MSVTVRPLTADRLPDLAALFAQGGDPQWCWFYSYVGMIGMRS